VGNRPSYSAIAERTFLHAEPTLPTTLHRTTIAKSEVMETSTPTKATLTTIAHGLIGWALCGATMGIGTAATTLENALVIHAAAAPLIFAGVALVYFRRFGSWSPLTTAATFLTVVIVLDFFVVALLIEKSFAMFRSILGTWLPFLLIFFSSWWTGAAVRDNIGEAP
jgi:hypothetical protein